MECWVFCFLPARCTSTFGDLAEYKWPIAIMATLGVLISTVIVATLTWGVFAAAGNPLTADRLLALWCLDLAN